MFYFIEAKIGNDKIGVGFIKLEQFILERAVSEEIIFLFNDLKRAAGMERAFSVLQLRIGFFFFAADAIFRLVVLLVYIRLPVFILAIPGAVFIMELVGDLEKRKAFRKENPRSES